MEHRGSTDLPAPSPTVSRRPESASSPSRGCRQIGGAAFAPPTRSSGCTRNSNAGSRRRPRCHRPTPQPSCSGLCSLPARATCARSMAGKHSTPCSSTSRLTLPPDQIASSRPEITPFRIPTTCRTAPGSFCPNSLTVSCHSGNGAAGPRASPCSRVYLENGVPDDLPIFAAPPLPECRRHAACVVAPRIRRWRRVPRVTGKDCHRARSPSRLIRER